MVHVRSLAGRGPGPRRGARGLHGYRWPCPDDDRYGESLTPGLAGRIHAHHGVDGEYAIPRRQDLDAVADGSAFHGALGGGDLRTLGQLQAVGDFDPAVHSVQIRSRRQDDDVDVEQPGYIRTL